MLTARQERTLHYLQSVGGGCALMDVPCGGLTISTLAQQGFINVRIKLTQKARNRLGPRRPRRCDGTATFAVADPIPAIDADISIVQSLSPQPNGERK